MALTIEQASAIMTATTIDIFNASSPSQRRKLMEEHWSPDIICYTPDGSAAKGFDAVSSSHHHRQISFYIKFQYAYHVRQLDQVWDGLHTADRKDWQFEKVGDLWLNHNVIQQAWVFGKGREGTWKGWDVIVVGRDGKVETLYALIEGMNSHSV